MNDFYRDHPEFSQCGLNCLLCPMKLGEYCPGCGGGRGNQSCAIARCAVRQGVGEFCTQCAQFPCEQYERMMEYDSFVPHSRMIQDLRWAETLGLADYIAQLKEKRGILDHMLACWNSGRCKSFYCLAAYLLDLNDLRHDMSVIQARVSDEMPVKEKALIAVGVVKATAEAQGVVLKLNKRPKEN